MSRYLIIGTGAAGVSAAETIRKHDPHGAITLVGEEPEGYYSRPGLAYLLTGEVPDAQLYPFSVEDFRRRKLRLRHGRVGRIDPAGRQVELRDGPLIPYDRLLIATGAEARRANVPGEDLPGVVKLDNFADARQIVRRARRARSAIVVGGGITALEIVEGLRALGVKTHYFLRGDRYWGNVLDKTESRIVEEKLREEGVQIHYRTELAEIIGKTRGLFRRSDPFVSGVRTKDGGEILCDIVAIAIGIVPRIELAKKAGLGTDRGILVDEYLRTGEDGIFAAGDVAQVYDPLSGKSVLDSLWPLARDQGRVAGMNMAGIPTAYQKKAPLNVTRLAGLTTTIIGKVGSREQDEDLQGIIRGDSETWREIPDAIASQNNFDVNRIRLMVGDRTLLGALVMGDQTLSQPIYQLIASQVEISPIKERLLHSNVQVGEVIAEFWGKVGQELLSKPKLAS